MPRLTAVLLVFLVLTGAACARNITYFHGTGETGEEFFLTVQLVDDGRAHLQLQQAPARPGDGSVLELAVAAPAIFTAGKLNVTAPEGRLELDLQGARLEGSLDSLGSGTLALEDGQIINLTGIGTELSGMITAPDGTFVVGADLPFFYREPWAGQLLFGGLDLGSVWQEGLEFRSQGAAEPWAVYSMEQSVTLSALSSTVLSALKVSFSFTGGAHPNTSRETQTLLRSPLGAWEEAADACAAVSFLGWDCDEDHVRELVISSLLEQEAEWVVQGEVAADTPWLLDLFLLESNQLTLVFDPYAAGPYVQGLFLVSIPYSQLAD